jgi:rod shape determining protein RodA
MKRGNVISNLDWLTIVIFILMLFLGWLNIFSAVYTEDHPGILDMSQRYGKQFVWICAALLIAVVVVLIDYRFYDFFAYLIYGMSIFLLMAVLVVGKEINGAKSWFMIGGFQIQPSEFAKPAVALALAKYLSGYNVNIKNIKTFLISALIIFTPSLLIMLQPDTGSAIVFVAFILVIYREGFSVNILLGMLLLAVLFIMVLLLDQFIVLSIIVGLALLSWWFISGKFISFLKVLLLLVGVFALLFGFNLLLNIGKSLYFIGLVSVLIAAAFFLVRIFLMRLKNALYILIIVFASLLYSFFVNYAFHNVLSNYQQHRINIVLGIESDPQGAEYNVIQSKIAIGSGGFTGKGFLKGTQTKLHFVPEQSTDFIFCTVGEEWGFIGSLVVIGLFLTLLIRLIHLAERQRSNFARIYGYGLISVILMHFFINISMTIGLFPVVGIPLPFFSYGGSSLWSFTSSAIYFLKDGCLTIRFY